MNPLVAIICALSLYICVCVSAETCGRNQAQSFQSMPADGSRHVHHWSPGPRLGSSANLYRSA